ncbi:DUF3987 domain-containing protein [Arenibacterium halophilum]|uniref:DUF3987 domain-containing protein n=1 Tax=Arenibacterium halophilum TaxID=2583821 RepID=A0ABY2XC38_9RHOB|nr:DUF3987 domain-containing protein [Arenibacterium halophilum]TMV14586.1 DUF3987 domain-containing protein [Arenibacterium halophilum]
MSKRTIMGIVQSILSRSQQSAEGTSGITKATKVRLPTGEAPQKWNSPSPLPHAEPAAIAYPVESLSEGLGKVVRAVAATTQAPEAIAAQSVLAAVSLTYASRASVQTLGSSANAACFFVLVALSGERKSATDRLTMGGVNRTVLELRQEHEELVKEHEDALRNLERGDPAPSRPEFPNFLVTEPTIEGAFKAISSRAGFLGWFSDEASTFFGGHSMSKEKQALTCGTLSQLWDGSFFVRPRASQDGDGYVPPTPTTLNLMFQPNLIRDSFGNEFMLGQGILARMLPAWPESNMGKRRYRPIAPSDDAIVRVFQDDTARALRDTLADPTVKALRLSDGAFRQCVAFHDDVEGELGRGKWAADISSFAAKAPEHACRIAALMTLYEDPDATLVSEGTMPGACEIVRYHLQQFKYLCVSGTNEEAVAHAQKLLDWLRSNFAPGSGFATDVVLQKGPVRTRTRKAMDMALGILVQHEWIAKLPEGTVVDGKARRRAYQLNPSA